MWLWKLCNKLTDQLKQESIAHIRALPYYKLPLYSFLFPIVVLFEDADPFTLSQDYKSGVVSVHAFSLFTIRF